MRSPSLTDDVGGTFTLAAHSILVDKMPITTPVVVPDGVLLPAGGIVLRSLQLSVLSNNRLSNPEI